MSSAYDGFVVVTTPRRRAHVELYGDHLPALQSSSTCEKKSPCWKMERERDWKRAIAAELEWTGLFAACTHPDLSAPPLYLVLCVIRAQFQVSDRAWDCQRENERERRKGEDGWRKKGSGQPVWCSQTLNSRLRFCKLKLQTTDSDSVCPPPFHRARPKSGLFMQASHPQMYIHMNSKHCLKLAVSLRCPNLFLYCTAPAQDKLKNLAPVQAGSVYPFQTIALTHKESIKRRRQWFMYILLSSCSWLQSPLQKSCMDK